MTSPGKLLGKPVIPPPGIFPPRRAGCSGGRAGGPAIPGNGLGDHVVTPSKRASLNYCICLHALRYVAWLPGCCCYYRYTAGVEIMLRMTGQFLCVRGHAQHPRDPAYAAFFFLGGGGFPVFPWLCQAYDAMMRMMKNGES